MTSRRLVLSVLLLVALASCTKDERPLPTNDTTPLETATATDPSATPTPTPSPTPSPAPSPGPSASPPGDGGVTCGIKPLPDCPLQQWMKDNTTAASTAGDLPALATALDAIVGMAPPGYPNWVSISKDGAAAARAGNLEATKAACTGCHKQYRAKYKAEHRARPIR